MNLMNSVTKKRFLLLAVFLFPVAVIVLFLIFGKSPQDPASTLPVMPPR
jgi:cell division septal protein FtsQ